MRNLPQSLVSHEYADTYKTDGRASDESLQWHMARDSPCLVHSTMQSNAAHRSDSAKRTNICAYLAQHRARLLLSFVSLAFLALFLLVIYRQFGLIVFASTLSLIVVPGLAALIYAKRLKAKEQEKARQRALNRSQSQRATIQPRQPKSVQIFTTNLEMAEAAPVDQRPGPRLQRKATQQKITIQLPPTVAEN